MVDGFCFFLWFEILVVLVLAINKESRSIVKMRSGLHVA